MFAEFIGRLNNPNFCVGALCGCSTGSAAVVDDRVRHSATEREDDDADLSADVPRLLRNITEGDESSDDLSSCRSESLKELCALTAAREGRRVELVCTTRWDVVAALSSCLLDSTSGTSKEKEEVEDEARRLALLVLNNLSIPIENKAVMVLGASSGVLLNALTVVMAKCPSHAYLCACCLMNLSYLEDAVEPILYFCPSNAKIGDGHKCHVHLSPLKRTDSLLRTLERTMVEFFPYFAQKKKKTTRRSVEGEAIRWTMGFVRNVTGNDEANATLVSRTKIPGIVVACIQNSPRPVIEWTKDSTEEMALQVMCNLARWPESGEVLRQAGALGAMDPLIGVGGIHAFRANMILCSLEAI